MFFFFRKKYLELYEKSSLSLCDADARSFYA